MDFIGFDAKSPVPPFPLFNVIGGEYDGSTVSLQTLNRLGIEVPKYPSYEEWRKTR